MGRRFRSFSTPMRTPRSSGLLETLVKSLFGFGTTVHHSKGPFGQTEKTVIYHDSGKSKTVSKGHGFLGNITRVEKRKGDALLETTPHKHGFWGGVEIATHQANGNRIDSEHRPGFFRNHGSRCVSGLCWKCQGTGAFQKTGKTCRKCGGSSRYSRSKTW
jgi:hypothetical protein